MIDGPSTVAGWFTIPTAARKADSTGRRNTLLTSEVFNDGDGGLEQEDQ